MARVSTQVTTAVSPWPRFPLSHSAEFICVVQRMPATFVIPQRSSSEGTGVAIQPFSYVVKSSVNWFSETVLYGNWIAVESLPLFFASMCLFWPRWIFVAVQAFSSCRDPGLLSGCRMWASHLGGVSCCTAPALGGSGFRGCGSRALELRPSSCSSRS